MYFTLPRIQVCYTSSIEMFSSSPEVTYNEIMPVHNKHLHSTL